MVVLGKGELTQNSDNLDDNGTLGWLIEFGMVDNNSRKMAQQAKLLKVPNFKQGTKTQTSTQRRSFDEKNKEVSGSLGLYIRSTIGTYSVWPEYGPQKYVFDLSAKTNLKFLSNCINFVDK